MLFSIVVPVYNAEKYLKNTIDSVISQSFTDWQLVLVNDGSTDKSLDICNEYRASDNRITVLSQKNTGPSAARNVGISAAQGEYILFLDSDDEYKPGAFEAVAKLIGETGVDLIMSSSEVVNIDTGDILHLVDYELIKPINSIDDFYNQMVEKRVAPGPCRYAIRKNILTDNKVFFPNGISIAEDCLWLNNVLGYIRSAEYNPAPFYKYNIHSNSITTTISYARLEDVMLVCESLFSLAESRCGMLKNMHYNYCCILANTLLQHYPSQTKKNKRKIKKWIKSNKIRFDDALKMQPPIKILSVIAGNFYSMYLFAWRVKIKNKYLNL